MSDNFRMQLVRGAKQQVDAYVGLADEVVIDKDSKQLRVTDGSTPGGEFPVGGSDILKVNVLDFSGGNFDIPTDISVSKEYSGSSLRIVHGRGKNPIKWTGRNKESNPNVGILASATINMQVIDANTVILTNVKNFNIAEYNIMF